MSTAAPTTCSHRRRATVPNTSSSAPTAHQASASSPRARRSTCSGTVSAKHSASPASVSAATAGVRSLTRLSGVRHALAAVMIERFVDGHFYLQQLVIRQAHQKKTVHDGVEAGGLGSRLLVV